MKYLHVVKGCFLRRPNRFIAYVEYNGQEERVHVKNTGRCRELLIPGAPVYLAEGNNPLRKTRYDLIAVKKAGTGVINMDSQAPNEVAAEWLPNSQLFPSDAIFHREVTWRNSRFDFYVETSQQKAFLEVKGVTLEEDRIARFPDAPTERGVKHLHELVECQREGYGAYILFVVQMEGMKELRPNDITHPEFGKALRLAAKNGVHILARECKVTPETLEIARAIPVVL